MDRLPKAPLKPAVVEIDASCQARSYEDFAVGFAREVCREVSCRIDRSSIPAASDSHQSCGEARDGRHQAETHVEKTGFKRYPN